MMKQNKEIPKGYKDSLLGIIPEEWEVKRLGEICHIHGGYAFDSKLFKEEGIFQIVKMGNLYDSVLDLDRSCSFLNEIPQKTNDYLLKKDDIVITLTGTIGKRDYGYTYQIKNESNLLLNQRVGKIEATHSNATYLYYILKTKRFLDQFFYSSRGGTGNQTNVSTSDVENIRVALPPLPEQQKIAEILTTWDKAIEKQTALVEKLELRKRGLMQQLFTGKKRLKGLSESWKKYQIKDIANEVSIRNKANNKNIVVLSCTKYDGLVPSLDYFGRKIFADDLSTYKIVPKNHFAYATNHIEEGSIGYQSKFHEALISPMYTVFQTTEFIYDSFLFVLLKTHKYILEYKKRMEGSIDRRGGLRWDEFSKIEIMLPPFSEQITIAKVLMTADREIELARTKLTTLRSQKSGLMQQLLTGKKRINYINS